MRELVNQYLALSYPLSLLVRLHDLVVEVRMNDRGLCEALSDYFAEFITSDATPTLTVHCFQGNTPEQSWPLTPKEPDPGKTRIKEEYLDTDGLRIVRKRLTGMIFFFDAEVHLAVGPCRENSNQVVNFVNNRLIQWALHRRSLLFHAAGVCLGERGLALAGFAGMGKSTLALHMMGMGMDFTSNDRLMVRAEDGGLRMYGVAKYPRINPGTVLGNPDLDSVIPAEEKEEFVLLPPDELRRLEHKYDVFIGEVYGPDRFRISAKMVGLVVLNWDWNLTTPRVEPVDISRRRDLLPAFMKSPGLFYLPGGDEIPFEEEAYLELLRDHPVFEVSGGVDFRKVARTFCDYLISG